jgi:hypothetical protein
LVLKVETSGEKHAFWETPEGPSPKALFVSIAGVEKYINMAALVLLKLISAQTHNSSLPAESTTWPTAESLKQ